MMEEIFSVSFERLVTPGYLDLTVKACSIITVPFFIRILVLSNINILT